VDEATARALAEAARPARDVPPGYALVASERRIIELVEGTGPGPVRDALVWIVRFAEGIRWMELAVEEASGQVVRVQRSRTR